VRAVNTRGLGHGGLDASKSSKAFENTIERASECLSRALERPWNSLAKAFQRPCQDFFIAFKRNVKGLAMDFKDVPAMLKGLFRGLYSPFQTFEISLS